ncbi:MAG: RHS repeat-associated core domain-containing protein, partial [Parcubacteria group bacterium]
DADGNMTQVVASVTGQVTKTLYQYDTENRLQTVRAPGVTNTCFYDGFGQRLRESRNGITTYLSVDYGDDRRRVLVETDNAGAIQRYYVWNHKGLLAIAETNGTMRYAHADEQGSTLLLTDSTGGVTDAWCYGPWGEVLARTGTNQCGYTWLGAHGVWNTAPNLYLPRHRAYDSSLKRFIHRDPIGLDGGANLYVYANNNPLAFIDPLGLRVELWSHGVIFTSSGEAGGIADPVVASPQHTSLRMYPDNPADFANRSDVPLVPDANGSTYVTLSAGPESGKLVSNPNRGTDSHTSPNMYRGVVTPPQGVSDTEFINMLVISDSYYNDNLEYSALPEVANSYNSNSYIDGLVKAAGGTLPNVNFAAPGYGTPVPFNNYTFGAVGVNSQPSTVPSQNSYPSGRINK